MNNAHTFALYLAPATYHIRGQLITFTSRELLARIRKILRLRVDDPLIVFNEQHYFHTRVDDVGALIERESLIVPLRPEITLLLPVLEKSALEQALYAAAVFGVKNIQLVTTHKSKKEIRNSELERARKIMIAACEQSKQYYIPRILEPLDLTTAVQSLSTHYLKLFGDPVGANFINILQEHAALRDVQLAVILGPEGGFTDEEIIMLGDNNFKPVTLGTSILRACDAVAALLGVIRAYNN